MLEKYKTCAILYDHNIAPTKAAHFHIFMVVKAKKHFSTNCTRAFNLLPNVAERRAEMRPRNARTLMKM